MNEPALTIAPLNTRSSDAIAAFLRDFMTEFRDYTARVLSVLPWPASVGSGRSGRCRFQNLAQSRWQRWNFGPSVTRPDK